MLTSVVSSRRVREIFTKNIRVTSELMMVDVDPGLKRPSNFTPTIQGKLLVVMGELDICLRSDTIPPKEDIVGVMLQDVEVGLKISATIHCSIL